MGQCNCQLWDSGVAAGRARAQHCVHSSGQVLAGAVGGCSGAANTFVMVWDMERGSGTVTSSGMGQWHGPWTALSPANVYIALVKYVLAQWVSKAASEQLKQTYMWVYCYAWVRLQLTPRFAHCAPTNEQYCFGGRHQQQQNLCHVLLSKQSNLGWTGSAPGVGLPRWHGYSLLMCHSFLPHKPAMPQGTARWGNVGQALGVLHEAAAAHWAVWQHLSSCILGLLAK